MSMAKNTPTTMSNWLFTRNKNLTQLLSVYQLDVQLSRPSFQLELLSIGLNDETFYIAEECARV